MTCSLLFPSKMIRVPPSTASLRVLQLNLGGLTGDPDDFDLFVRECGADVLLLQELSVHYDASFSFVCPPGFQHVCDPYGKTAVMFPSSGAWADPWTSSASDDPRGHLHYSAVRVTPPQGQSPIHVCSFYRSPNGRPPVSEWSSLLSHPSKDAVVGGDANVSSRLWGGATRGPYERDVEDAVLSVMNVSRWRVANDGSPSRVVARATPSHLDVTWCSSALSLRLTCARFEDPGFPSDHLQHMLQFKFAHTAVNGPSATPLLLRICTRASPGAWAAYAARLDRALQVWEARYTGSLSSVTLSKAHRAMVEIVRRVTAHSLGTFAVLEPAERPPPPISPAVKIAKRDYMRALRTWQKTGAPTDKQRLREARAAKVKAWARHYAQRAGREVAGVTHGDRRGL